MIAPTPVNAFDRKHEAGRLSALPADTECTAESESVSLSENENPFPSPLGVPQSCGPGFGRAEACVV